MGCTKKVQRDQHLWKKIVPKFHREIWVGSTDCCDEVIFERANSMFGGISSVNSRGVSWNSTPLLSRKLTRAAAALLSRHWRVDRSPWATNILARVCTQGEPDRWCGKAWV